MLIKWNDGELSTIPFVELRFQCRCAECVDEWTRERRVVRSKIPVNIKPVQVESVGRYAIQCTWSDGHRAGIYPFELLYSIAKGTSEQTDPVKIIKEN